MPTTMNRRCFLTAGAASALIALAASPAIAQSAYPNKPIKIVVPFGPGGSSDVMARILSGPLQQALGASVIVENRAGSGSNLGTAAVARSEPDGYTLLLTTSAFVVNPSLYKNVPYDPVADFAPVADLAVAPNILVASPKAGIRSLQEAIARAKAEPDKYNYSSAGIGTTPHLSVEWLKLRAGINLTHIIYQGGGPATQAVLSGTVELFCGSLPNAQEHVKTGGMIPLGITSAKRWPDLPDVPTLIEQGVPDFVTETGHFLLAPAGTPPDIAGRIAKETLAILARPEMQDRLRLAGFATIAGGPDVLKARIAKDVPFYRDLITRAKVSIAQ